jgi:hypothetical protein
MNWEKNLERSSHDIIKALFRKLPEDTEKGYK